MSKDGMETAGKIIINSGMNGTRWSYLFYFILFYFNIRYKFMDDVRKNTDFFIMGTMCNCK